MLIAILQIFLYIFLIFFHENLRQISNKKNAQKNKISFKPFFLEVFKTQQRKISIAILDTLHKYKILHFLQRMTITAL
ncbi:hypothetical protein EOPP23_01005 [Endozoicomonas sp. OPT23]|nr:hypothetical protein [Endozoicomonas sp. OPT23]